MSILTINHIEKSFGDVQVLKDISLTVEDGEILSIMARPVLENPPFSGALRCWRPWIKGRFYTGRQR